MSAQRVLVAFASRSGSTAVIAEALAGVLRAAGLAVDSRPERDVADVAAYDAVVLGSGVFLSRRRSDGGGFLVRHRDALDARAVWLFCAGPIGRCSVDEVARSVGARGSAVFGTPVPTDDADLEAELTPVDLEQVREWGRGIAAELAGPEVGVTPVAARTATERQRAASPRCTRAGAAG